MTAMNELVVLAERPTTIIEPQTCRLETAPIPEIADGEALVQVGWLSIDPTIRTWMDDAPGYLPPIGIGDVVRSGGIGTIIESSQIATASATRSSAPLAGSATPSPVRVKPG